MQRLIFVQLDGLRYSTARETLGWPEAMVRAGHAQVFKLDSELPAQSRPLYETLLTGLPPVDHGVISNRLPTPSSSDNVFARVRAASGVTAAAAYYWISELYLDSPFQHARDRMVLNGDGLITHGLFYWEDHYPDSHLFADAQALIDGFTPDFLLLHPMNVDNAGHRHGGASREYRNAARVQSDLLAQHVPGWLEAGYTVIVTSDHGMGDDGNHCGPTEDEATVPLYLFGPRLSATPRQVQLAGLVCRLMQIDPGGIPAFDGHIES